MLRPAEAWVGVVERERGTDWAMGLGAGRRAGSVEQIGDEGVGQRAEG